MRLLDLFRRPDRVRAPQDHEREEEEAKPLPARIEPPVTSGAAVQDSLPNRASEEDAA